MRETQANARVCQSFQESPKFPISTYIDNFSQNGEGTYRPEVALMPWGLFPEVALG